ncbi:mRNA-decapping enzyme subunit 2 [Coemansia sp. RSA 552]|nr:mRNA-decapping enzyme subunit 2 [Coemansia sp. RSA 552]
MFEEASFAEVLDDLASRFIINVPEEELQEIARICFQIEQAHWFYEDFVREQNRSLPSMTLKTFAKRMFKHCPLLSQWAHDADAAYQTFLDYKFKVPVCGAIILNRMLDKVLLVKGWSSRASWGFPRGKINKDEPEWQCAQREVIEETGYDILPYLDESERIEIMQADQKVVLYIITGIPEDTEFMPTVRKEISEIQWHYIDDLPCSGRPDRRNGGGMLPAAKPEKEHRYYLIKPFVKRIKGWIARHPERFGVPATAIDREDGPLVPLPAQAVAGEEEHGGMAGLVRPGVMSVQELFNTVSRARSPVANAQGPSRGASPPQHKDEAVPASASLLQTLMGGGTDGAQAPDVGGNGGDNSSKMAALASLMQRTGIATTPPPVPPPAQQASRSDTPGSGHAAAGAAGAYGPSAFSSFALDTKSIMSAFHSGSSSSALM